MSRNDRRFAVGRAAVTPATAYLARIVGDRFLRSTGARSDTDSHRRISRTSYNLLEFGSHAI